MRRFAAEGALVLAAFFFGVTFPLVHDALGDIEPFAYLVLRFAIAVVVIAPFAIVIGRRRRADVQVLPELLAVRVRRAAEARPRERLGEDCLAAEDAGDAG